MFQNITKHKDTIFEIKMNKLPEFSQGGSWIIKYKNYYYIFLETNGKEIGVNLNNRQERYLIFKKLTLNELMLYDNGSYWKLIKDYNIKID